MYRLNREGRTQANAVKIDSYSVLINNLKPICEKTCRLIISNPLSEDALKHERSLWNEIKKYRDLNVRFYFITPSNSFPFQF